MTTDELRSTFRDVLSRLLTPNQQERQLAEQQLQALQVTDDYGIILTEFTLAPNEPLGLRQMTAVLLKQFVDAHWSSNAEKFLPPEVSPSAKATIRRMLPAGLSESISKVRSCVAYTISAIAHWDWPEEWPELFDILVDALKVDHPGSEFSVQGAVRVLKEFSRDLTDSQIPQVAPVILPDMYRIFMEMDVYSLRTRTRAIEIFTTMANMICAMGEVNKSTSKSLLGPILPTFTEALVTALHVPDDSHLTDPGLKTAVLKALKCLLKNVPKSMASYHGHIIPPVWTTLTSSAGKFVRDVVNETEDDEANDDGENVDSDGEVLGFENLVFAIFDMVHGMMEAPRYRAAVKGGMADLLYYIIVYMQITEEQCMKWSMNPNQFVEDEDEESMAFSVRISAQDLLVTLSEEFEDEFIVPLRQTVERHLTEAEQAKQAGNPHYWKIIEAVMLTIGLVQDTLESQVKNGKASFDLSGFLQNIVLANLSNPASPFLFGRCLWVASKYPNLLPDTAMPQFVEATVRGLQSDQLATVRISAVRAIWGFCSHLRDRSDKRSLLVPVLPAALDALLDMCSTFSSSSEILCLVLENMTVVLSCDKTFTASVESKVSPAVIDMFLKYSSDPMLVNLTQEVFKVISSSDGCLEPLQQRLTPTLVSILDCQTDKVSPGLQAVALDVLQTLVRASQQQQPQRHQVLSDMLMHSAFPAAVQCVMKTDDNSTMQSGGECLRAYVSVSPNQICSFADNEGKTGLWYLVQVTGHLLNPVGSEFTATFVGRLVITLIQKTGDRLGEHLELLLKAVLSKLQSSETLSVIQSLLMVYAHLIHTQLNAVLNFLSSVPGPSGQPALDFVLNMWVSRQHVFYGAYENKVSITALAKLLEHGVNSNDTRLQSINVQGDLIINPNVREGIRTRAAAKKLEPEQYTRIPVLVKILKLIINEMSNNLNEALASAVADDYDDDEGDSDGWEDQNDVASNDDGFDGQQGMDSGFESTNDGTVELSKLLDPAYAIYQDEDDEEDPDAKSDPIYNINLKEYLSSFLCEFCKQPYFLTHFAQHLTQVEKKSLNTIGVQVS